MCLVDHKELHNLLGASSKGQQLGARIGFGQGAVVLLQGKACLVHGVVDGASVMVLNHIVAGEADGSDNAWSGAAVGYG